jgi:hypothetical protein
MTQDNFENAMSMIKVAIKQAANEPIRAQVNELAMRLGIGVITADEVMKELEALTAQNDMVHDSKVRSTGNNGGSQPFIEPGQDHETFVVQREEKPDLSRLFSDRSYVLPNRPKAVETTRSADQVEKDKREKKANEILSSLSNFIGTESYYRYIPPIMLTDGAKALSDAAGAYWLMDVIASWQGELKGDKALQVWTIKCEGEGGKRKAVITCDDGNGRIMARQEIHYTDFPIDEYKVYCNTDGDRRWIVLLTSEY